MSLVGKKAPQFTAPAVLDGEEIVSDFSLPSVKRTLYCFSIPRISPLYARLNCMLFKKNWLNLKKEMQW